MEESAFKEDEEACSPPKKQKKSSSKRQSVGKRKMLQEGEFTALLNSTTSPDVGSQSEQLLARLVKLGPSLLKMGKILVSSVEFSKLLALMLHSFQKQCLTIYRRKEVKLADKKAELCVSWIKYLDNFKPGRNTEERRLLEAVFAEDKYSAHEIHSVSKELHQSVYSLIHANAYETKKKELFPENAEVLSSPPEESMDKIYSFAGASLHRMKKKRSKALAGKGSEVKKSRIKDVEDELRFLEKLSHDDKQQVKKTSTFLRELDFAEGSERGGLTLPASELLPFLRELDGKVRELINTKNHRRYGKSLLRVAEDSLTSDLELRESFTNCVASLNTESTTAPDIQSICKEFIKKYLHAREGEFKEAVEELSLNKTGAVVSASQNLRDSLKTYSINEKRKR